jgi:hypothetical protein
MNMPSRHVPYSSFALRLWSIVPSRHHEAQVIIVIKSWLVANPLCHVFLVILACIRSPERHIPPIQRNVQTGLAKSIDIRAESIVAAEMLVDEEGGDDSTLGVKGGQVLTAVVCVIVVDSWRYGGPPTGVVKEWAVVEYNPTGVGYGRGGKY